MAAKVALTAEEFRENSQRSIALFNTEKLSTDSTHVLKSAYCNSVHFCRCNLHGACGGKGNVDANGAKGDSLQSARGVWRQSAIGSVSIHAQNALQSARGVWRQSSSWRGAPKPNSLLQSARGVWRQSKGCYRAGYGGTVAICTGRVEAKKHLNLVDVFDGVAICTGRVEAKIA